MENNFQTEQRVFWSRNCCCSSKHCIICRAYEVAKPRLDLGSAKGFTQFAFPHFAPHTLLPLLCTSTLCALILCATHFAIPIHSIIKLHRNIALICRPILLLSFVYALFKQNQCYETHKQIAIVFETGRLLIF